MTDIKAPRCRRVSCQRQILAMPRKVEGKDVCEECYKNYRALLRFFWNGGKPTKAQKEEIGIQ